jgi:uncharacterized membrane protein
MTLEDTIHIAAPPDVVWAVTEEIERWPEWTPTVTAARRLDDGPFGIGSRARIKQPAQPETDWTVTEYVRGERFTWESRRRGLRLAGSHRIRRAESGTFNTLRIEATGVVAMLFWPLLRVAIRRALETESRGLKSRCEQRRRSIPGPGSCR